MASKTDIENHDKLLTEVIDTNVANIEDATKAVENRLAEVILAQADPATLVNNRAQLQQAFQPMSDFVQTIPAELQTVADDTVALQGLGDKDQADTTATQTLSQIAQNSIETEIQQQQNSIIDEIVIAGIAGVAVDQLARQARTAVSGVFAETSDAEARRLQRELRSLRNSGAPASETQPIVTKLKEKFAGVTLGANLRETVRRKSQDTVMRFEGAFSLGRAKRKEVKRFEYAGGVIETSREFCQQLDGAILTEEEIYNIWNSDSWAGKEPGDPFVVRGGYNCRHFWVPVEDE